MKIFNSLVVKDTKNKNDYLLTYVSLLVYFLPVAIVSGPFLSDFIISLLGLYFIYVAVKFKNFKFFKNYFVILFCLFYLYILLRSLFSDNILLSLESSLFYFRFLFFSLGICYLIKKNKYFQKYFLYSLLCVFTVLIFDGFFEFIFQKNIFWQDKTLFLQINRISSFFGDELILGSYLSRIFPLLAGLIFLNMKRNLQSILFIIILIILIDILTFISGERSAFAFIILSSFLMIFCLNQYKFIRLITFLLTLFLLFYIQTFNKDVASRMIYKTLDQLSTNNYYKDRYNLNDVIDSKYKDILLRNKIFLFSLEHNGLYYLGYRMFKDNIFFGHGPKLYREKIFQKPYSEFTNELIRITRIGGITHPHNTYVQLLSETGLVGFFMIIFLFFYVMYKLINQFYFVFFTKKKYLSDFQVCLLICFFISLWPIIPTGNFFNNWLSVVYYLPLGFYFSTLKKDII